MKFVISIILILLPYMASGYELATHARITKQAYLKSILNLDEELLLDYGLETNSHLTTGYFDVSDTDIQLRIAQDQFVLDKMKKYFPELEITDPSTLTKENYPYSPIGWLMRGAIREDDWPFGANPNDGPVNAFRIFNHFFDPVNNGKLWLGEYTAPNWALGTEDAFPVTGLIQPLPDFIKSNHFTMFDAREAQYRALTGHAKDGSKNIAPLGLDATEPQIRDAYLPIKPESRVSYG